MPKYEYKKKQQNANLEMAAYNEKEQRAFNELNNSYDMNAVLLESQLSKMSEGDIEASRQSLEKGYREELLEQKGGTVSEREQKNINKKAAKMSRNTSERSLDMHKKVEKFASSRVPEIFPEDLPDCLTKLAIRRLKKNTTKDIRQKFDTLKKQAPDIFKRYFRLLRLKQDMMNEDKTSEMIDFEFSVAKSEWELAETKVTDILQYTEKAADEDRVFENKRKNSRGIKLKKGEEENILAERVKYDAVLNDGEILNIDPKYLKTVPGEPKIVKRYEMNIDEETVDLEDGYVQIGDVTDQIKKNLEKKVIDWKNVDINTEYNKEANNIGNVENVRYYGLNHEGNKDDIEEYNTEQKQKNDKLIQSYTKSQMDELIEKNQGLTYEKIETTINGYLKKIADKAALRIRTGSGSVVPILNSCLVSRDNTNYKNLIHLMYDEKASFIQPGNITFGYLGGHKSGEYVGRDDIRKDQAKLYGNVSLKLNRKKVANRVGFLCGNSLDNYSKKKARSLEHPDILAAGQNIAQLYKRALEVEEAERKGQKILLSPEQEAAVLELDSDKCYFEFQIIGRVSAAELEEITYMLPERNLTKNKEDIKEKLKGDEDLNEICKVVEVINRNPKVYGREGMDKLKVTVWGKNGTMIDYDRLKQILS